MTYAPWTCTQMLLLPWYRQGRKCLPLSLFFSRRNTSHSSIIGAPFPRLPPLVHVLSPCSCHLASLWEEPGSDLPYVSTSKYQQRVSWLERMQLSEVLTILVPWRSSPRKEAFQAEGTTCAKTSLTSKQILLLI